MSRARLTPGTSYRTPEHPRHAVAWWEPPLACAGCGRRLRVAEVEGQAFGAGRRRNWCGRCAGAIDAARWVGLTAARALAATAGSGLP